MGVILELAGVIGGGAVAGRLKNGADLDLSRAPYVLYGVKYIDLVSRAPFAGRLKNGMGAMYFRPVPHTLTWIVRPMFCMVLNI